MQAFNVLKYELSQHYDSHYDRFDTTLGYQTSKVRLETR